MLRFHWCQTSLFWAAESSCSQIEGRFLNIHAICLGWANAFEECELTRRFLARIIYASLQWRDQLFRNWSARGISFSHIYSYVGSKMLSHLSETVIWKKRITRKITGENNTSSLVSIKCNERIYEATTFHVLMEVTVVRMFRFLRHSCRVLF